MFCAMAWAVVVSYQGIPVPPDVQLSVPRLFFLIALRNESFKFISDKMENELLGTYESSRWGFNTLGTLLLIIGVYALICYLIAISFKGRRKISVTSLFFVGFFFTPALGLFVGLVYPPIEKKHCPNCGTIKEAGRIFCPACKRNEIGKTAQEFE